MSIKIYLHGRSIKPVTYVCKGQSPSRQLHRKLNYSPYIKGSQIGPSMCATASIQCERNNVADNFYKKFLYLYLSHFSF